MYLPAIDATLVLIHPHRVALVLIILIVVVLAAIGVAIALVMRGHRRRAARADDEKSLDETAGN